MLDAGADTLDGVIAGHAAAAGATFVDVRGAFAGPGGCPSSAWINGLTWPVGDSFHPGRPATRAATYRPWIPSRVDGYRCLPERGRTR